MRISVVSGGFDPLHSGHLSYLFAAAKLGEKLIVCLNSDEWLTKKKGKFFLPFIERKKILQSLEMVDFVYSFEDDEQGSCINGLKKVIKDYPKEEIINILQWSLDNLDAIYSTNSAKPTGEKRKQKIQEILSKIQEA